MEQAHRNDLVTGKTLARIGLGLLLLGIVFLYRWGIENNHIPVEARVGVGVALSLAMLGIGWATRTNRLIFGALLQGGGVAGLFVSAFAAHTVYGLTSEAAVFTPARLRMCTRNRAGRLSAGRNARCSGRGRGVGGTTDGRRDDLDLSGVTPVTSLSSWSSLELFF